MQEKRIKIAIDAMGGDFAPGDLVKGALQGVMESQVEVILVGDKDELEAQINSTGRDVALSVSIVHASQKILDNEEPAMAVFNKRDSSMVVATKLVKEGRADAVISAGPTGALMTASMRYLGTLPGIERPVMGGPFLGLAPNTLVMDLGASVGCQPYHLVSFAVIGVTYAQSFMGMQNPTVGLLNVGTEEGKGDPLTKEAYGLLKKSGLNFIGNVEGMDIVTGKANVIVCDGFTGNILLKYTEGLGRTIQHFLTKNAAGCPAEVGDNLYRLMSPAVLMGGGPMLGINGIACKAHGSSRAQQIAATVRQAKIAVESGFIDKLRHRLEQTRNSVSV
jgi:glycerol-3-phosphate acyltransferase PlsX